MKKPLVLFWLIVVTIVSSQAFGYSRPNLVSVDDILESHGVLREQRLFDGVVPSPQSPVDDFTSSLFLSADSRVVIRLPRIGFSTIRVYSVDASIELQLSTDGKVFETIPLQPTDRAGPMLIWSAKGIFEGYRFAQLQVTSGSSRGAVGEWLFLLDKSAGLPVRFQDPPNFQSATGKILRRRTLLRRLSFIVGVGCIVILFFAFNQSPRCRTTAALLVIVASGASWLEFGFLQGDGRLLHPWEISHYYLGSKYFSEMRYQELYRCIASHEFQGGRGSMVTRSTIRNLDDNQVHPGIWALSQAGSCRTPFSPARWEEFGHDANAIRWLFSYRHFHSILKDHGYNATPTFSSAMVRVVNRLRPTKASLTFFAVVDLLLLVGSIGLIAAVFGIETAAIASLIVGFGLPWGLEWTGGSLGRYWWLFAVVLGITILKRERHLFGGLLLAVSGLFRLFPFVLLAGLVIRFVRHTFLRQLNKRDLAVASGIAIALTVGIVVPMMDFGPQVFGEFLENGRTHASRPPGNDLGLGAIFSTTGLSIGLPDKLFVQGTKGQGGIWILQGIWFLGLLAASLFLVWLEKSGCTRWELVAWSGPLLYATLPLSGYDYVWLVLLAPLLVSYRCRMAIGGTVVVSTKLIPEFLPDYVSQHLVTNILFLFGFLFLAIHEFHAKRSLPRT